MSRKSVFVSALDVLTGFFTSFVAALQKRGGTDEQLYRLFVGKWSEDFINRVADLAMERLRFSSIFQTVSLGQYESIKSYYDSLIKTGITVCDKAKDIINGVQVSRVKTRLNLVILSVFDLGFCDSREVRYYDICAKAKELGYKLCPAEAGLALRLAPLEWPKNIIGPEEAIIAMHPILCSDETFRIFRLCGSDALYTSYGGDSSYFKMFDYFVFVLSEE